MRKIFKRTMAALITLALTFSMLAVTGMNVFAEEEAAPVNLALGKTATARFLGNGTPPSGAVDGNINDGNNDHRWGTPTNTSQLIESQKSLFASDNEYRAARPTQWLTVDLGSKQYFNKVAIYWETSYAKAFEIQVSDDGETFTTVASVTDGKGGTSQIEFETVYARYVRMQGVEERGNGYGYSIWEFEVYEAPGTVGENLALGKKENATTRFLADGNRPEAAVDGLKNGDQGYDQSKHRWGTPTSGSWLDRENNKQLTAEEYKVARPGQWLTIDLGSKQYFNRVVIYWNNHAKEFEIQVSDDGETFTTVASVTDGKGGTSQIVFDTVCARYVRMQGIKENGNAWGYSIEELEVYRFVPEEKVTPGSNLAWSKDAFASKIHNNDNKFAATKVTNGNNTLVSGGNSDDAGRWNAGQDANTECWIYVDLAEKKAFDRVMLYWNYQNCPSGYDVQISDDATNWTTVKTLDCGNITTKDTEPYIHTFDFQEVEARYVRVYVPAEKRSHGGSNWVSLVSFEVYCVSGKNAADVKAYATVDNEEGKHDLLFMTNITKKATSSDACVAITITVTNPETGKSDTVELETSDAYAAVTFTNDQQQETTITSADFEEFGGDYVVGFVLKNVKSSYAISYLFSGRDADGAVTWKTKTFEILAS